MRSIIQKMMRACQTERVDTVPFEHGVSRGCLFAHSKSDLPDQQASSQPRTAKQICE